MRRMSRLVAVCLAAVMVVNIYMTPRANAVVVETSAAQRLASVVLMYMAVSGISTSVESMGGVAVADVVSTSVISSYAASIGSSVSSLASSILSGVTLTGVGTIAIGAAAALALGGLAGYIVNQYQLDQANQRAAVWSGSGYPVDGSVVNPVLSLSSGPAYSGSPNYYYANEPSWPYYDLDLETLLDPSASFWTGSYSTYEPYILRSGISIAGSDGWSLGVTGSSVKCLRIFKSYGSGTSSKWGVSNMDQCYKLVDGVVYATNDYGTSSIPLADAVAANPAAGAMFLVLVSGYLVPALPRFTGYYNLSSESMLPSSSSTTVYTGLDVSSTSRFISRYPAYAATVFGSSVGSSVSSSFSYVGSITGDYDFSSEMITIDPGFVVSDGDTLDDVLTDVMTGVSTNTFAPSIVIPETDIDWTEAPAVDDSYADGNPIDQPTGTLDVGDIIGLITGTLFVDAWKYVLQLIAYGADGLEAIAAVWSAMPYAVRVPYYASIVITLVFGLIIRFLM